MTTLRSVAFLAGALLLAWLAGCKDRAVIVRGSVETLSDLGEAPGWTLPDLEGEAVDSQAFAGKVVIVDFWATWCSPCLVEIPHYIELQKKYGDQGLVVVGISMDHQGAVVVRPFAAKHAINYPVVIGDADAVAAFGGVEYLPTTFLIDREGKVRHRKIGSMDLAEYERLIKELL